MIQLYNANAYEAIKSIADNSVDLIITDPPYAMQDYGKGKKKATYFNCKMHKELQKKEKTLRLGFDYKMLFAEFERIQKLRNMYIFCNYKLMQELIAFLFPQKIIAEVLVLHKRNPMPSYNGHYANDTEYCLYICGNKGKLLDFGENPMQTGRARKVFSYNISSYKMTTHPTEKPLRLIDNLLLNSSKEGDLVLDCFAGSGTTARACKLRNRRFIGYEIDKDYYEQAIKSLNSLQQSLLI